MTVFTIFAPEGEIVQDSLLSFELSEAEDFGLFVPDNWATGVLTNSKKSIVWSTSSAAYEPEFEMVIPAAKIDSMRLPEKVIVSVKDS